MQIQAPQVKYARYSDGAIAASVTAVAAAWGATHFIDFVAPIANQHPLPDHLKFWGWGVLKVVSGFESQSWRDYLHYMQQMSAAGHPYAIPARMYTIAATAVAAGLAAGWRAGKPISDMDKISGNDLLRGKVAINYFNSQSDGSGLHLLNGLELDVNKETEHLLISGGTGAGKSVSALNILLPALERGDRIVLVNYKGLVEKFPVRLNTESLDYNAIILCPFDRRSAVWAIWLDVTSKTQAREFAARMIPESKDPVWSNAGRFVMTGIIMYLINNFTKKGEAWSWKQFADLCVLDREALVEILTAHYPEGLRAIKEEGKTSESVLMNFGAFAAPICDLADAWGDRKKGFSIEKWITNPYSKIRTVILQLSSEFEILAQAFNQTIIAQITTYTTRLADVSANVAPLWIYADEFPRIGKAKAIDELIAAGRSKSFRIALAIQDLGQLRAVYGQDVADSWVNSIGTKVLGRSSATGAQWVSEMCGKAVYAQLQNGRTENDGRRRNSYGSPMTYDVFPPELATDELGIPAQSRMRRALSKHIKSLRPKGVRMLILGVRGAVLIVNFPFLPLPSIRKETVLADWARGGFGRAQIVNVDEVMEAEIAKDALSVTDSYPAPLLNDNQSDEATAEHIKESQSEVFTVAETTLIHEHKPAEPASLLDDELLQELGKEVAGETLDKMTDSHLSLVFEAIEIIEDTRKQDTEPFSEVSVSVNEQNSVNKKKRYLSRKQMKELQC